MTTRTRYFVIASLLVLVVGVGTGLVAYYAGFPGMLAGQPGLDDLRYLPRETSLVAYANVREVMGSQLRQKLLRILPLDGDAQRQFAEHTGVNIEADVDQVVVGLAPGQSSQQLAQPPPSFLLIVRGRLDTGRIEGLMRQQGAHVEDYKGVRVLAGGYGQNPISPDGPGLAFIEPGAIAVGNLSAVKGAVDRKTAGGGVTENAELMTRLRASASGDIWAAGQFDQLMLQAHLPQNLTHQLPAIAWFGANANIDNGLRATIQAEARDEESANNLRDVIRGLVAFGKLQVTSQPVLKGFVDSLELAGTGNTVALSFNLPAEAVDLLASGAGIQQKTPESPGK